ncbi:MAG: alpha-glucan phosphorylase [Chloroflexi bacterium HGW-Chloroflexi-1]|nr:MAG: alpha-glucan phosphorylase [Chloroflexi bacterium HGW-Chloroflexi-1]
MKIMGQIAVYPAPGPQIARLPELAYNLWWSWHGDARALYRDIDPQLWDAVNHNPVKFLRRVSQEKLDRVAADPAYVARYRAVMAAFDAYMGTADTWYARTHGAGNGQLIAYFSAEFGLHEALPIYSGGLGILSGDHCKTASDLGLPFVGVGFLYPQGYFQQRIKGDGRQQAIYEKLDFSEAPATPALGQDGNQVVINVDLPGRSVYAKMWRIQVGRIPIYLMDTDVERNAPADRELSARLYGGDQQIRISQEVMLGIGGVRALRALGLWPTMWHMNEGHAAFLQLERIREYVEDQGLAFPVALWAAKADALFTTHTPVPAGNDSFPFELMDRFFGDYWGRLKLDRQSFLALGRFDYAWGLQFSMTVLALRTAGMANGVSRLHGEVSRRMWRSLWPEAPQPEIPISFVTNGVHTDSWLHPELAALFDRYLGPDWRDGIADPATWTAVAAIPDEALWAQHRMAKAQMLELVRARTVRQLMRVGAGPVEVNAAATLFDPHALTIGFARRFATYKRATLLFRDPERLRRLLDDPERPVQIVFSGKAHPADEPGKALIQTIYQLSRQPDFAGRIVFVEDYDANIARRLVAGVDVWLNTPRRPLEASGTSGQKAGLNGVPNFSVLDGWWSEGYDGRNGWAIGQEREYVDEVVQDEADALSLYATLENEIVPLFYDRGEDGIPTKWLAKMRASIASVAPAFSFDRMLKEYVARFYVPGGALGGAVGRDGFAGARVLAEWEQRVQLGWPQVSLTATGPAQGETIVGQSLAVQAVLTSSLLEPKELAVELVYGLEREGELRSATVVPMRLVGNADGKYQYEVALVLPESGAFVYGVRVRPDHANLPNPFAMYLVRWA